jgi:AbrB family looped-hinge helix DNA binding protein
MSSSQSQVEYVSHTRIGEKGQLTIPKQYRDELGLATGAPVAVLRIGEGLMLIPEQNRFRILCESIASVLEHRQLSPADLLETLPEARQRVFVRRYPELAGANAQRGGASVVESGGTRSGIPRLQRLDRWHSFDVGVG